MLRPKAEGLCGAVRKGASEEAPAQLAEKLCFNVILIGYVRWSYRFKKKRDRASSIAEIRRLRLVSAALPATFCFDALSCNSSCSG